MNDVTELRDWHEMQPIIRRIYDRSPAGCCWHIVLADGNVDDDDVEFCVKYAAESDHCETPEDCRALGPLMTIASRTQRTKAARM